jgi:hypothetical protein
VRHHPAGGVDARDAPRISGAEAKADGLGQQIEMTRDRRTQLLEAVARQRGHDDRARTRRLQAPPALGCDPVRLVEDGDGGPVARPDLLEHGVHRGLAMLDVLRGRVHDVQEEVGLDHFLQRGPEGHHQRVRQLLDEADGVDHQHVPARPHADLPDERIQRHEELVRDLGPFAREGAEQGRLARVGVAHQRHHRGLRALARFAPRVPRAPDLLDLALDVLDPLPDAAAVRLQLRLPGPPGADAAAQAREEDALAGQARQHVVELGQLDLQTALTGARAPGEDVEDQLRAVHGLALDRRLDVALLRGGELVVEDHQVGLTLVGHARHLFHLAAADEGGRILALALLDQGADDAGTRAFHEQPELLDRRFRAQPLARARGDADEDRLLLSCGGAVSGFDGGCRLCSTERAARAASP